MNFTETLQRAKPGSMVDVRSPDNQIDSFRVEDVLAAIEVKHLASSDTEPFAHANFDIITASHPSPIR